MKSDDVSTVSAAFAVECHGNMARLNALLQRSRLTVDRFERALRELERRGCLRRKLDFVVLTPRSNEGCTCDGSERCAARPLRGGGRSGVYARSSVTPPAVAAEGGKATAPAGPAGETERPRRAGGSDVNHW